MNRAEFKKSRTISEDFDPAEIQDLSIQADYWHGTGRFRHDKENPTTEPIDVLQGIIDHGVLPHHDNFTAEMGIPCNKVISLSQARMYAAVYAKMFLSRGTELEYEYGNRVIWSLRYQTKILLTNLFDPQKWRALFSRTKRLKSEESESDKPKKLEKIKGFVGHCTKESVSLLKAALLWVRTDIEGNYPIIIGIPQEAVDILPGAHKGYGTYEARTNTPFRLEDCTHIEVPLSQLESVKGILERNGINTPVVAIEDMELHFSKKTSTEIMKPKARSLTA